MANTTVYPFGTEGHLPESVGIINDLTTGGADKALSAQMGVQLQSEIAPLSTLAPKVNELVSDLYKTVDVAITPEDADDTYTNTYLNNNGASSGSQYYDTYCKAFPDGGKIKYSINYTNLGVFVSDTDSISSGKTKIAYNGDADGTYTIPAGKYLFWDVYKGTGGPKISIKVETLQIKDILTDEDLEPIEEDIAALELVTAKINTNKIVNTYQAAVGSFGKDIAITTDKPFRVSIELLSGKYTSSVGFYVTLYYSDNPSVGVLQQRNSVSFDDPSIFYPAKEISKIHIHTYVGFAAASQVKITIQVMSDLLLSIYDQKKPWTGKKIVCFGDSITELIDRAEMSWPDHLAKTTGAKVVNLGLGGTCIKPRSYSNTNTYDWAYSMVDILNAVKAVVGGDGSEAFTSYESGMQYIYDHVNQLIVSKANVLRILEDARATDLSEVDAIVIFAGFNDWYQAWFTKEQVYAALVEMVQTISAAYPKVQVYYCNPMPCFPENIIDAEHFTDQYTRGGISQEEFCEKMNEIGEGPNLITVFDSYHYMGINAYNGLGFYSSSDGVHPYPNTKIVGRKIGAFLNSKYCI